MAPGNPVPTITETHVPLKDGTMVPIAEASTPHIIFLFLYWRGVSVEASKALAQEIRRRLAEKGEKVSPGLSFKLMKADPPPCKCGRVGIYIVGDRTFCRFCRPEAVSLSRERIAERDKRAGLREEDTREFERLQQYRDRLKSLGPVRRRK